MKKEIADIWVAALRSGEYEQGTGKLRLGNKFCCLGVLCDLAIKNGVELSVTRSITGVTLYDGRPGILPIDVQAWANLKTYNGSLGGLVCLSEFNDNGKTFEEIADIIEENWKKL